MRIFNGTNSLLTLPLSGNQKLEIHPKSVSQEFMGSTDFISMIVTSLKNTDVAIIVSGPYELNVCSNVPTAVHYVVQTLDEAIIRLGLKKPEPEVAKEECKCEKCKAEEEKVEEPIKEETKPAEPEITEPEPEQVQEEITETPEEVVEVAEEEKPAEEAKPKKSKKKAKK